MKSGNGGFAMTQSRIAQSTVALVLAAIAVVLAMSEGRAQTQAAVLPPLSVAKAQYFKDHPDEWNKFLSQLPQPSAEAPWANPQAVSAAFGGTWTTISTFAPMVGVSNPLLLTDGTVIFHIQETQNWYKLTPDINGSYVNGAWTQIGLLQSGYGPLYFASAVLPDGRVIIQGGEYNTNCTGGTEAWTSLGAIYDPAANVWTPVSPPSGAGWVNTDTDCKHANGGVGDAASIVLPNGTFMLSACCAFPSLDALFNAATLTYSATGAPPEYQNEQGYTLLPNGLVLTIDVSDPPATHLYNYATGTWTAGASTPVSLVDPTQCGNQEIGPAVTRPDGTVVAFGGNSGCTSSPTDPTAIYTASNNSWTQGPNVPALCGSNGTTSCTLADAPAVMLPNGNILFAASAGYGNAPTHFFEFTSTNVINQVADTNFFASSSSSYYYNFLVLPNGQIFDRRKQRSGVLQPNRQCQSRLGADHQFGAELRRSGGLVPACRHAAQRPVARGGLWRRRAGGDQLSVGSDQEQQHRARVLCPHHQLQQHVDCAGPGRVDELQGGELDRSRREHALCHRQRHPLGRGVRHRQQHLLRRSNIGGHPRLQRRP